jgi:hypothetical protein
MTEHNIHYHHIEAVWLCLGDADHHQHGRKMVVRRYHDHHHHSRKMVVRRYHDHHHHGRKMVVRRYHNLGHDVPSWNPCAVF